MNETDREIGIMQEFEIDTNELQKLQDKFCHVSKVVAYCVNEDRIPLTKVSGIQRSIEIVSEHIQGENIESILNRVLEDSLEEQAVADLTIPNLKLAAISIRVNRKSLLTWIVCSILSDADTEGYLEPPIEEADCMITEKEFYEALDLLRESSKVIFRDQMVRYSAEAESLKSKSQEKEMGRNLKTVTAMSEIVQLLDSDESIEVVLQSFLKCVGNHLEVSHAQILQFYENTEKADVLAEWANHGFVPFFDKSKEVTGWKFFDCERVIVISSDSMAGTDKDKELSDKKIKAVMVFPVLLQSKCRMMVSFVQTLKERIWAVDEVKFVSHAVKILQNILTKRIQKNSLASSYQALESVLDNVGCAIYVKDKETNEELFTNKQFKNTFSKEISSKSIDEFLESGNPIGKSGNAYELYHQDEGSWYDMLRTEISWVDGRRAKLYSLYDITDKKLYQKKIIFNKLKK